MLLQNALPSDQSAREVASQALAEIDKSPPMPFIIGSTTLIIACSQSPHPRRCRLSPECLRRQRRFRRHNPVLRTHHRTPRYAILRANPLDHPAARHNKIAPLNANLSPAQLFPCIHALLCPLTISSCLKKTVTGNGTMTFGMKRSCVHRSADGESALASRKRQIDRYLLFTRGTRCTQRLRRPR